MRPYNEPDSNRFRIIPTKVHGVIDYVVAVLLFFAPNLFGFEALGGAAVWVPRVLGVAIFGMSLLTRYELGVLKVIPMSAHLLIDIVAAIFLTASPFVFGFSDAPDNMWVPHVIFGLGALGITLLTQTQPYMPQVPAGVEHRPESDIRSRR